MPSKDQFVSLGMSSSRFKPVADKASLIQNMVVTGEGGLKSITGPTLYEPREVHGSSPLSLGRIHAGWHGYFGGGDKEVLIIHAGGNIWVHWGAIRGWDNLPFVRQLSDSSETFSQFVPFNNGLVFCDGYGPPLFITEQLDILVLGFPEIPSPPVVRGPESPNQDDTDKYGEGFLGYSWHGGFGSPGDRLNGENSHVLQSEAQYKGMYESFQGDLSAPSEVSSIVQYGPKKAKAVDRARFFASGDTLYSPGQTVRDLQRGIAVVWPDMPDNAKYYWILRTKDTQRNENDFYMNWKVPVSGGAMHDWRRDAGLTRKAPDTIPVPSFSGCARFKGSLAVIDGDKVRLSQPNFPGTYERNSWVTIASDGRQGTALFSLAGKLYAATDTSIIDCTNFAQPVTVSSTIGVASMTAFAHVPGLGVVIVARQGVYALTLTELGVSQVQKISEDIDHLWHTEINKSNLKNAVVWYSDEHSELRIAVTNKGEVVNKRVLTFSAHGWRQLKLGIEINCAFKIEEMEVIGGDDKRSTTGGYGSDDLFVLGRETTVYDPPARSAIYKSDWQQMDNSVGMTRAQVLSITLCFAETSKSLDCSVNLYRNYETAAEETVIRLHDVTGASIVDNGARRSEWGNALVGTDSWEERRVVWRTFKTNLADVQRFRYEVITPYPTECELLAVTYSIDVPAKPTYREPEFQD